MAIFDDPRDDYMGEDEAGLARERRFYERRVEECERALKGYRRQLWAIKAVQSGQTKDKEER